MEMINWKDLLYPYQQTMDELLIKFRNLDAEYRYLGLYSPIDSVTGRVKSITSILEKANRKQIPADKIAEEIEDIAGLRILCQFTEDIPKVVEMIRRRKDMRVVEERDYVHHHKESGYRSYHMIIRYPLQTALGFKEIPAEIQIRTNAMNFWAAAEHSLRYKYSGNVPKELQERLINCAEAANRLDEEMSTIREEITNATRENQIKEGLVSNILDKLHILYFRENMEEAEQMNEEFIHLWNEGNLEGMKVLNDKLNVLAETFRL